MAEQDEFRKKTQALLQSATDTFDRFAEIRAKAAINCDVAAMQAVSGMCRQYGLSNIQAKVMFDKIQKESVEATKLQAVKKDFAARTKK